MPPSGASQEEEQSKSRNWGSAGQRASRIASVRAAEAAGLAVGARAGGGGGRPRRGSAEVRRARESEDARGVPEQGKMKAGAGKVERSGMDGAGPE